MSKYWIFEDEYEAYENMDLIQALNEQNKEIERLNNIINELEEYLNKEQTRLATGTSHTYEDSLNKTRYVNEDIFNEITNILDKLKELRGENK